MSRLVAFSLSLLLSASALAVPAPSARQEATLLAPGQWSVGVFNPLHIGLNDILEISTHPLLTLSGSPNALLRVAHLKGPLRVTGEYGLSLPTLGARFTQGFLFPSWETSGRKIGWALVPRAGVVVAGDVWKDAVWTARADLAVGLALGAQDAMPLESFLAPLDLLLAPMLNGFRARIGGSFDKALSPKLRGRLEANLYAIGRNPEGYAQPADVDGTGVPLYLSTHAGLDIALSEQARLTFGVYWYNYQQFEKKQVLGDDGFSTLEPVRSNNIVPSLDFVWTSKG